MAIQPFLAMTAAEMRLFPRLPEKAAWMACHFSPYGLGLSNLPRGLPPGALLIVDDITPMHGHDPERIAEQLREQLGALDCPGVLLDFQRAGSEEAAALVKYLVQALPCPVSVSDLYAGDVDCPVFLPPVPPSVPLTEHLTPWKEREVWLEIALNGEVITLTENGAVFTPMPLGDTLEGGHREENLHSHYRIHIKDNEATFTLWRTWEDLEKLLKEAEELGVTTAVGLYQELHSLVAAHAST